MQNSIRRIIPSLAALAAAFVVVGCSGVTIQPDAEQVEVLDRQRAEKCEQLGQTRVSVAENVGFIARGERHVQQDLRVLARNSAADMGGDTVAPLSEVQDGKQTYGVYDCIDE